MAPSYSSCFSLNVLFVGLICLLLTADVLCTESFSMDQLMHWDHPESSLHNTTSAASRADYLRSADSGNSNSHLIDLPFLNLIYLPPAYVANIVVGKFEKRARLVVSFAGTLSWLSCTPCTKCYNTTQKRFRQTFSKSYIEHDCENEICKTLGGECDGKKKCAIKVEFMHPIDGYVKGMAAADTVRLLTDKGGVNLDNTTFGCITETKGNFHKDSIGMIGLGPGPHSFLSQLQHYSYKDMFSYCLPYFPNGTSKLILGSIPNMPDTLSIPLNIRAKSYVVHSVSFQIGGPNYLINYNFEQQFVMDPAYYFTYVSRKALNLIITEMKERIPLAPMSLGRVDSIHELCFDISLGWNVSMLPKITFRMVNGVLFPLRVANAFEKIGQAMCLTILSNEGDGTKISIFGNRAQLNKRIGIDITGKTLSFRTENCY